MTSTPGLSIKLEALYMDTVHPHFDLVISKPKGYQSRVDEFHHDVYNKTLTLVVGIDVRESSPDLARHQTEHHNVQAANAKG